MQNFQRDNIALYKITSRKVIVAAIIAVMPQISMAVDSLPETPANETSINEASVDQLPEVKVSADQEKANGVVNGYVAKRAKTATKTDTPIVETPQSISVITRDQMRDQNVQSVQDALRYSAGVAADQYGSDSRADNITIRGAEGTQYLNGLRQVNTYYQDLARPDPFTLERIEILRGPSAMLFGSGGVGGVVNLVTKRPQEIAQNQISVSLGNYDSKQIQADFTGPVADTDNLFYRLVFVGRDYGTQVDHTEDKRTIVAPSLTWKNEKTSVTLLAQIQRNEVNSTNQFLPASGTLTANPNGKIKYGTNIGDPDTDKYNTDSTAFSWLIDHNFNDTFSVHQNARYNSSKNTYNVLYGNPFDPANRYVAGTNERVLNRVVDFSKFNTKKFNIDNNLQAKFSTDNTTHIALLGVDYSRFKQDRKGFGDFGQGNSIDVFNPVYAPVDYSFINSYERPTAYQFQTGIYLQDQIKFDQRLIATLGLRHDRATSKNDGSASVVDQKTTGRYGLTYLFDSGWAPYVSYAESFQPVAGTNASGSAYKPQEGEQYELGIKYMPEGSKTKFTAAIFDLTDKNRLTPDPFGGQNPVQKAEIRSRGLELEAATSFDNRLDLITTYSYTNAKYNKSNVPAEKGNQIEAVPKHLATAWVIKRFAIGDIDGFRAGLGVRYIGESYDSTATLKTPDVTLFDAMLGFDHGAWRYALNASNLADKEYVASCLSRGDCWLGAKRVAFASATYNF